ncbi:MAG: SurA N-terminal domain-containing protein [Spirochaetales bacterium]|nr:SurA N-terminal domain-containing protein [Spirochaetales bacterium]
MASREHRRMTERKKAGDKTQAEIRREHHPVFYWMTFIILMLVVIAFIGSGIVGGVPKSNRFVFGKYGNKEIELARGGYIALNFFTEQLDSMSQNNESQEQTFYNYREAFDNTLTHYAIIDIAKESGYQISKKKLDKSIANHSIFQTDGRFDEKKYNDTSDMEKSLLKNLLNELLLHNQFIDDVFFTQIINSKEIEFYKEMKGTERKFSYVSYRYSDFPEEKILTYGNENTRLFKKMRLSRILLTDSSEKAAGDIRSQIENKIKSFEELAKEKSKDIYAEKGGDMGSQYYYQIQGFIDNKEDVGHIFSLKKDELSRVIQNGENFEIYRCNSEVSEPDFSDTALLRTVREYMMRYQKDVIEEYSVELADTFKKKSDEMGFEPACKELDNYPPYDTEFFPINYLEIFPTKTIKAVEEDAPSMMSASGSEDFFIEAFALKQDEVSAPIRLDDQVVVLTLIEEKTMAEDDWESENILFKTSLSYAQNDFTMRQLLNQVYMFAVKHYQNPRIYYQYLFSRLLNLAEEKNVPYEYAFKVFLNIDSDFERIIEEKKAVKAEDNFEEMYQKLFVTGAR